MRVSTVSGPTDVEQPSRLAVRPEAELFPMMEGDEFEELMKDIEENGQRDPIVVHPDDGRMLDGRNRERACFELGIRPVIAIWDREPGEDALKFVVSRNLRRRHLDTSQRALIGAQIANMRVGENQHSGGSANLQTRVSSAKAAEIMNVSERQLNTGRRVIANAPENIAELVKWGELSLHQAAAVAMASDEAKSRIASLPEQEVKKEAKRLTKSATGAKGSRKRNEGPSTSGSSRSEVVAGVGCCATCGAPTNWRELIADGARSGQRPFEEAA